MDASDSVTRWLTGVKAGDETAAARIVERYSQDLLALANQRLPRSRRRSFDADDVVQSAFASMFRRAKEGAFAHLQDRDNLWRLLVTMVRRKTLNAVRAEMAQRRGGGRVAGDSGFDAASLAGSQDQPTPEMAAAMHESLAILLERLGDQELQQIALLKLDQHTDEEVAQQINRSRATVERRLRLIRSIWKREAVK